MSLYGRLRAYQSEERDEFIQLDLRPEDGDAKARGPRRRLPTGDQGSARRYPARTVSTSLPHNNDLERTMSVTMLAFS
jgi:hypothetical protein